MVGHILGHRCVVLELAKSGTDGCVGGGGFKCENTKTTKILNALLIKQLLIK